MIGRMLRGTLVTAVCSACLLAVAAPFRQDGPGLPNVVAYHEGFYSGGSPIGPEGFETLAALGVRTIISVDGAAPDVAAAEKLGMRYIHLPIGYDGFNERRRRQLARATRDAIAAGAVYVHCHHGKHRSAAAAGTVAVSLGWATPDDMVERMRVSGTSPHYAGLYARTANARPIPASILDAIPANFPSVSRPTGLVESMVELETVAGRLHEIEEAGWKTPPDHPDLMPAAEAGRLADLLRLLDVDPTVRAKPEGFAGLLRGARDSAQRLEDLIVQREPDPAALSDQLDLVTDSCNACHAKYRD